MRQELLVASCSVRSDARGGDEGRPLLGRRIGVLHLATQACQAKRNAPLVCANISIPKLLWEKIGTLKSLERLFGHR